MINPENMKFVKGNKLVSPKMVYGVPTPGKTPVQPDYNDNTSKKPDLPNTSDEKVTIANADLDFETEVLERPQTQMVYGVPTPNDKTPVVEEFVEVKPDVFEKPETQMIYGVPTPPTGGPTCVIPPAPGTSDTELIDELKAEEAILDAKVDSYRQALEDEMQKIKDELNNNINNGFTTFGTDSKVNNNTVTTEDLFMANYDRELANVNIENVAQQIQLEPEKVATEMMNIQRQYELTPEQALLVLRSKHFDGSDNLIQNILERAHNDNTAVMKEYSEKYNLDQNNARLLFRAENGLEPALTKYAQLSNISLVDAVRRGQNQQTVRTDELNDISQGVQETASSDKKAELPKTFDEYAEIYAERTGKSVEDAIKDLEQQKERYKQRLSLGFRGAHIEWNDSSLEQYIITQAEANFNKMQMMSELSNRAAAADTATNVQSLFSSATTIAPENYSEALQSLQEQEAALDLARESMMEQLNAATAEIENVKKAAEEAIRNANVKYVDGNQ